MMRKGPLDRYPADLILREAATTRVSGVIEFDGPNACTVYLVDGELYHAHAGVGPAGWMPGEGTAVLGSEEHERAEAVRLIAAVLDQRHGWYSHHPLHHHESRGAWSWNTFDLVREARGHNQPGRPLADVPPIDPAQAAAATAGGITARVISLTPPLTTAAPGPDGWQVIVALTQPSDLASLAHRLGWDHDRLAAAVEDLEASGLTAGHRDRAPELPSAPADASALLDPAAVPVRPRTVAPTTTRPPVSATVLPFPSEGVRRTGWRRRAGAAPSS